MTTVDHRWTGCLVAGALGALLLAAPAYPARAAETAVAPEKNPPGDIPDDQVFVTYKAKDFSLKVPEGWARTAIPDGVVFADRYGSVSVTVAPAAAPPTLDGVKAVDVPDLVRTGHAVTVASTAPATLKAGAAVKVAYTSNSDPNAVTGRRIRLENERYLLGDGRRRAVLTLSAPAGADNVDQWKLIAESFRWE